MKPIFILVPGAWHQADHFKTFSEHLEKAGYASEAVKPGCMNSSPPTESFQPDVDACKAVLISHLSRGNDVILCMHSYGGFVGTETSGLIVADAEKYPGKIRRLVYMTAYVPIEGQTVSQMVGEVPAPLADLSHVVIDLVRRCSAREIPWIFFY